MSGLVGNVAGSVVPDHEVRCLLLDAGPLTGVCSFFFDAESGVGQIEWWKGIVADRDDPDRPYAGITRTTSRVVLILNLYPNTSELDTVRLLLDRVLRGSRPSTRSVLAFGDRIENAVIAHAVRLDVSNFRWHLER